MTAFGQFGQSEYDPEITRLRDELDADLVVVVVIGGTRGDAAGGRARAAAPITKLMHFAALLRNLADDVQMSAIRASGVREFDKVWTAMESAKSTCAVVAYELGQVTPLLRERAPECVPSIAEAVEYLTGTAAALMTVAAQIAEHVKAAARGKPS